jgi:hypothetical protein
LITANGMQNRRRLLLALLTTWIAALVAAAWVLAALLQSPGPISAAAPEPTRALAPSASRAATRFYAYLPGLASAAATQAPPPADPTRLPDPLRAFDFANGDRPLEIAIVPPDGGANAGEPFELRFVTGDPCRYEDKRACLSEFDDPAGARVTFLTIHSGMYAEGQPFRHAVEGTALYAAAFSLERIAANLESLAGAPVVLTQGEAALADLEVALAIRLPPDALAGYFAATPQDGLAIAARYDPRLTDLLSGGERLVMFETCGWRVPGEPAAPGTTDTSASIYLVVIRARVRAVE